LSLIPECRGLSFLIFAFRLGLVSYGNFNLREQRIVFFDDQPSSFIHVLLRTRPALRLERGSAAVNDCNDLAHVHGTYFAFFRFAGAGADAADPAAPIGATISYGPSFSPTESGI
jgi:hypothetical protein